ncbi:capsid protein [Xanthomonas hortorum pv. hederae]
MGDILSGLSGAEAAAALIGAGAIIALVGFTGWGVKKVAGFFRN